MKVNADFSQSVTVDPAQLEWQASPLPGVERRMLDRIGGEVARATSIVRYAPGSSFSEHIHGGGEEFIVLEGIFQDEHGDYPAGTYVRNPPTSHHVPRSDDGCTIFVKLWQFDPDDRHQQVSDLSAVALTAEQGTHGATSAVLFSDEREVVSIVRIAPGADYATHPDGGAELLVLEGALNVGGKELPRHGWHRSPDGAHLQLTAGADGAFVWLKTGHLAHVSAPAEAA